MDSSAARVDSGAGGALGGAAGAAAASAELGTGTLGALPPVIETIADLRARFAAGTTALVPTMGALHEGHLALVERARDFNLDVVVSIFVNPLQFGPSEDFEAYPRDLDDDLRTLAGLGVAAVFHPGQHEMYPNGVPKITVSAGEAGRLFEGRSRPGHFDGALTVVAKLLGILRPAAAMFGQKDAQQLFLVGSMVRELDIPTTIVPVETVRADDGLALSSRNRYLSREERFAARAIPRALEAAASAADRGIDAAVAAAQSVLMGEELVTLDYLRLVDPKTFLPIDDGFRGAARAVIAAKVGPARLIDNELIYLS